MMINYNYKYFIIMMKMCLCVCSHVCTCLAHSYLKWKRIANTRSLEDNHPWLGYNTSSISLVFDFSNESTLEWRLLTVLLKLIKKNSFRITQTHKGQEKICYLGLLMLTDMHQLPCLNFLLPHLHMKSSKVGKMNF